MAKHYVGARYVPKFASPVEWAPSTFYEALTIVTFNNASYTSKVPVPPTVGNPANNPQYWALTGNYNAQVEQYRQETETVSNNLTREITNRKNADTTLQSQINQIVAPSGEAPSAAEVQNARIGADGVTYDTLGNAIRGQVTDLKSDIDEHSGIISANLMGIDVQENLYPGAADWGGTWINSDPAHVGVSDVVFEGYPTVYSSESWRRYCKNIPVEAGKTYTFEAWIKHAQVGAVNIYLLHDGITTNPATISEKSSKQWNNIPANTWTKLSYTFSVTASGNVSPFAHSGTSAFYIAKYNLVEGDSVFSLSESLNTKASVQSVSGIGDFLRYDFSLETSPGTYWNNVINKVVSSGDKLRLIFDSYSGQSVLNWVRVDGKKSDGTWNTSTGLVIQNPTYGHTVDIVAAENYTALRVQFARATNEGNVAATVYIATNKELGITNDLLAMSTQQVFHIAKDGSGEYTSFVDGINEACKYMDSVVYVGAGTYDLLSELGSDYIRSADSQKMGLVLKNRVHVICSSQTVLTMNNKQSLYETEQQYLNAKKYLSPLNTGAYGCTLENATIIDNNVRYSVHDDQGWSGDIPYTNKFINCTLIHKNGMYGDCIGGGLGENCCVEIRGCYLEGEQNVYRLAYYHANNHTGITNAKGHIVVCDNYFANNGAFWLHKYGTSTEMTTALVSNNSFGSEPQITSGEGAENNMRMIAWNNEIRSNT